MSKWVREIFTGFIGSSLVVIGPSIVVAILAFLQHIPYYLIFISAVGMMALVLLLMNQRSIFMERRKKSISKLSDKAIENTIRGWLDIPAFSVQRKSSGEGRYFHFGITDSIGHRNLSCVRIKKEPLIIILGTEVNFTLKNEIADIDLDKIKSQLSIELARFGIQFTIGGTPGQIFNVQLKEDIILDDSLTSFYFRQKIMFVIRAVILVQEIWRQHFKYIQPQENVSAIPGKR